ncbi:hypothetical protein FA13DRAFT_1729897 [Coprinellus micaceus]|uniref:Uncharacterized protein n=1 Tax=Coprinellus micaceus TaxID=71717 RepID=A0A4Y7TJN3_COPMI|nr:hypothetical protein FA13DRAFT_1729897 [Coprinellus micaceus]
MSMGSAVQYRRIGQGIQDVHPSCSRMQWCPAPLQSERAIIGGGDSGLKERAIIDETGREMKRYRRRSPLMTQSPRGCEARCQGVHERSSGTLTRISPL